MKSGLLFGCALISLAAIATETPQTQATLTMTDGSSVKGELLTEEIKGVTVFDQKVAVPVVLLRSVTPGTTNSPSKLAFANGDTLSLKMTTDELKLESILGKLEIPRVNIRKAAFARKQGRYPDGLVYWCTFDGPESIATPNVGPGGALRSGSFVPGHDGNALRVDLENEPVTVLFDSGLVSFRQGTIDFWMKFEAPPYQIPDVNTWPRVFHLQQTIPNGQGMDITLARNNGIGFGGICGVLGTMPFGRSYRSSPSTYQELLQGAADAWHHYIIIWNANGIQSSDPAVHGQPIAILVDGRPQPTTYRNGGQPTNLIDAPFKLTFGTDLPWRNSLAFYIDDFHVWNIERTQYGD